MGRIWQMEGQMELMDLFQSLDSAPENLNMETMETNNSINQQSHQLDGSQIDFYQDCIHCWCSDCKHNMFGKAIPRDLCGEEKPCPACLSCKKQGSAEICIIGSAKNGCRLRAEEEGLWKIER